MKNIARKDWPWILPILVWLLVILALFLSHRKPVVHDVGKDVCVVVFGGNGGIARHYRSHTWPTGGLTLPDGLLVQDVESGKHVLHGAIGTDIGDCYDAKPALGVTPTALINKQP